MHGLVSFAIDARYCICLMRRASLAHGGLKALSTRSDGAVASSSCQRPVLALPVSLPLPQQGRIIAAASLTLLFMLTAPVYGSFAGTYFPEVAVPSTVSCDTCQLVVAAAGDIIQNTTSLEQILTLAQKGCASAFPNDTALVLVCDIIADLVVDKLLPAIDKGVTSLAWTPQAFCATVIPVCTIDCCATPSTPEQLHLSFAGSDLSQMVITWTTLQGTATSTVQWGTTAELNSTGSLPYSATGSNRSACSREHCSPLDVWLLREL